MPYLRTLVVAVGAAAATWLVLKQFEVKDWRLILIAGVAALAAVADRGIDFLQAHKAASEKPLLFIEKIQTEYDVPLGPKNILTRIFIRNGSDYLAKKVKYTYEVFVDNKLLFNDSNQVLPNIEPMGGAKFDSWVSGSERDIEKILTGENILTAICKIEYEDINGNKCPTLIKHYQFDARLDTPIKKPAWELLPEE